MKIRANNIDLIDEERYDSFSSVIINCKNKYCCFNKNLLAFSFLLMQFINLLNPVLLSFLLKQQYLFLQLIMTLEKLSKRSTSIRSKPLALIFMLNIELILNHGNTKT